MRQKTFLMFPILALGAIVLAVACGQDKNASDKNKPKPEPGGGTPTVTPTPTSTPSPDVSPTPSSDDASSGGTPVPEEPLVYETIKPLLAQHCGSCHIDAGGEAVETYPLKEKEDVIFYRFQIKMALRPTRCKMPPEDPEFCKTDAAKKIAEWAASNAE